jgi:hypothetical protein
MERGKKLPSVSPLLSKKDVELDKFVKGCVASEALCGNSNGETASREVQGEAEQFMSLEEKEFLYNENASNYLLTESPVTWERVDGMLQKQIKRKLDDELDGMLATVVHSTQPLEELVHNYRILFLQFINYPKLSFQTGDPGAMGNIAPKDYWVLQYFALSTCRRNKGDKCLQLGLVGCTSVGKSSLFETPLSSMCHQYLGEQGVGRFKVGKKSILFFHDIEVEKHLVSGCDKDIVKTLARGESTKSKVHSSTNFISPVHLFYTSNYRLFEHKVELTPRKKWNPSLTGGEYRRSTAATQLQIPLLFGSMTTTSSNIANSKKKAGTAATAATAATHTEAGSTQSQKRQSSFQSCLPPPQTKKVVVLEPANVKITEHNKEHVKAMRARFLECFCPSPPGYDTKLFPASGTFQRTHMICGIFTYVLDVLDGYSSLSDFAYIGLPLYVLCGLAKNVHLYESVTGDTGTCSRILNLAEKFFPTNRYTREYNAIFGFLCNNPDFNSEMNVSCESECDFNVDLLVPDQNV